VLARAKGNEQELKNLYNQHKVLSFLYKSISTTKNNIYNRVVELQSKGDITKEEIQSLTASIKQSFDKLNGEINELDQLDFIEMPNISTIDELKEALVENKQLKKEHGQIFENGGFQKMMQQLETTIYNCQRIEQKSINSILVFHKGLEPTMVA